MTRRPGFHESWLTRDDVKPAYSDFDALLAGMHRINEIDRQIAQARMDMARDVAALIAPDVERNERN